MRVVFKCKRLPTLHFSIASLRSLLSSRVMVGCLLPLSVYQLQREEKPSCGPERGWGERSAMHTANLDVVAEKHKQVYRLEPKGPSTRDDPCALRTGLAPLHANYHGCLVSCIRNREKRGEEREDEAYGLPAKAVGSQPTEHPGRLPGGSHRLH